MNINVYTVWEWLVYLLWCCWSCQMNWWVNSRWFFCMQWLWTTNQRAEFCSSTEQSFTVMATVATFRNPPACVKVCVSISWLLYTVDASEIWVCPSLLLTGSFNPLAEDPLPGLLKKQLVLKIISGQQLPKPKDSMLGDRGEVVWSLHLHVQ